MTALSGSSLVTNDTCSGDHRDLIHHSSSWSQSFQRCTFRGIRIDWTAHDRRLHLYSARLFCATFQSLGLEPAQPPYLHPIFSLPLLFGLLFPSLSALFLFSPVALFHIPPVPVALPAPPPPSFEPHPHMMPRIFRGHTGLCRSSLHGHSRSACSKNDESGYWWSRDIHLRL